MFLLIRFLKFAGNIAQMNELLAHRIERGKIKAKGATSAHKIKYI